MVGIQVPRVRTQAPRVMRGGAERREVVLRMGMQVQRVGSPGLKGGLGDLFGCGCARRAHCPPGTGTVILAAQVANRHLRSLTPDGIFNRWQERMGRISLELTYLFETRRKFRDVEDMFTTNARLNATGSQAWEWLLLLWGARRRDGRPP